MFVKQCRHDDYDYAIRCHRSCTPTNPAATVCALFIALCLLSRHSRCPLHCIASITYFCAAPRDHVPGCASVHVESFHHVKVACGNYPSYAPIVARLGDRVDLFIAHLLG